jgi:hypothetical protein
VIEILKKKTIEKCGFSMLTLGDCQKLSNHILEFQDDFISYNTLRRFFNVIHNDIKPSENTLNILSRFNGYNDYNSFSLLFKFENKWKVQNDIYELINDKNSYLLIDKLKFTLKNNKEAVSLVVQAIRELFLEDEIETIIAIFKLDELKMKNFNYDEVIHFANGIGNILRNKNTDVSKITNLLDLKNYRDLVMSVFVDYSHLNGYYIAHIDYVSGSSNTDSTVVFCKCLQNMHCFLNNKEPLNIDIQLKDNFHPILKSRIISQNLLQNKYNRVQLVSNYCQNIGYSNLRIEHFYELIITSMICKDLSIMNFIIKVIEKFDDEIYLYQIRHSQHFILMKSLYFSTIGEKTIYSESITNFSFDLVSKSYKQFVNIFFLIAKYNVVNSTEKILIFDEYKLIAKQLGYPLFDTNYIESYSA